MMTPEENRVLTQVGPETPMGRLMRRFWHPVCSSAQLPAPDCDPLRTRLLGEDLVVFRDTQGRVGVLDEFCMHRRASLALGRVEGGGIRCLYHGWKFAVDGTILETPNHCNDSFRKRLKAPAYSVREAGGMVWAYLGPRAAEPEFPHWPFFEGPDENRVVIRINTAANYLQLFEGGTDSSHVGILHSNRANPGWMHDSFVAGDEDYNPGALAVADNAPALEIEDTAYGYHYAAKRVGPPQPDGSPTHSIRVTPVILPTGRIIPAPSFQFFVYETPQDDHKTSTYLICHGPKAIERADILRIMGLDDARYYNEKDCEFTATWADRLGQDRSRMAENWSGYSGIEQEDAIMALSMGPIVDRSKEHLVAADRAVVHLRARLLESVRLNEAGEVPLAAGIASFAGITALADTIIPTTGSWQEAVPTNRSLGRPAAERALAE